MLVMRQRVLYMVLRTRRNCMVLCMASLMAVRHAPALWRLATWFFCLIWNCVAHRHAIPEVGGYQTWFFFLSLLRGFFQQCNTKKWCILEIVSKDLSHGHLRRSRLVTVQPWDKDATTNLLESMPRSYSGFVRAQFGDLGTLHDVINISIKEEQRRNGEDHDTPSLALSGKKFRRFIKFRKSNFNMVGPNSNSNFVLRKSLVKCFWCHKLGHQINLTVKKELRMRKNGQSCV